MTTLAYDHNLARVTALHPDRVELAFDLDHDRWPWLALPPQHLVLLEKYQYFGSLTALWAMKLFDPGVFTALTWFEWTCPAVSADAGYGVRGACGKWATGSAEGFTFDVDAANGERLLTSRGAGVAFPNRDYKSWRARSKHKTRAAYEALGSPIPTGFAAPSAVGLGANGVSFVTPLKTDDDGPFCDALVSLTTGFHPQHPFHTGSGDHVNAGHLFDCVLQATHLVVGASVRCVAGRAEFTRYVELGVPFRIRLAARAADDTLVFHLSQLGRRNGVITYTVR